MTRPIYEPSLPRKDAYLDFQDQQLFRRPAPSAACPCPVEWAYAVDGSSDNISDNTLTTTTFESYAIGASVTAILINTATKPFKLVASGWYHFWVDVEWSGAGFADVRMALMSKSGGGFFINNDATYLPRTLMSDPYLAGTIGSWGPLYANCDSANNIQVGVSVRQSAGSTQTRTAARFSVVYFGPAMDIPDYDGSWSSNHLVSF